jgi:mono/diheme cytochrome c family protein
LVRWQVASGCAAVPGSPSTRSLRPTPPRPRALATCWLCSCLLFVGSLAAADDGAAELAFSRRSEPVATRDLAWLRQAVPTRVVRVVDPYEEEVVEFEALAFDAVLDAIYGRSWRDEEEVLFRCRDGYQPTVPVERIIAHRAQLAFARRDRADFTLRKRESGVSKQIDLAPFYLVWENLDDTRLRAEGDYGWPYQLIALDLIRARDHFPKMAPALSAPAAVQAGFAVFRVHCSRCHTLNGEGGSIGPELNGPIPAAVRRDTAWLRRWIDDPSRVLPTARMERLNPALPERKRAIDEVIRYLQAMAAAKTEAPDGD